MIAISEFPGYFVTDEGQIFSSRTNGIMRGSLTTPGYMHVVLRKNGIQYARLVHRLVCAAFHENPEGKKDVNHKDGNKLNNHPTNLEWNTRSENQLHAWRTGLHEKTRHALRTCIRKYLGKPVIAYTEAGLVVAEYSTIREAAKAINRSHETLSDTLYGKQKRCAGLKWQYKKLENGERVA
jgi:hypothetical protein